MKHSPLTAFGSGTIFLGISLIIVICIVFAIMFIVIKKLKKNEKTHQLDTLENINNDSQKKLLELTFLYNENKITKEHFESERKKIIDDI